MSDSSTYLVERATRIAAPEPRIRALIDDFHHWRDWSPWEDADPDLRRTYSGPGSGVGARYDWEGNRKAGAGTMTITASEPGRVGIDLAFRKPFESRNEVTFLLVASGETTEVTWRMTGRKNLFFKVVGFLFPMDRFIGPDFEKGLVRLKGRAEAGI
ncbi:SRPBCC family protein [Nocardia rhamnosiphila]|uniref:SRPBCC family protein n=1 Tax=Nocardia rhamnosiphila TaxID=426716 RepID=A0ABV2WPR1_9NOCA|nr:SRPBCC family protein [Nocardia rhamnosiphila]